MNMFHKWLHKECSQKYKYEIISLKNALDINTKFVDKWRDEAERHQYNYSESLLTIDRQQRRLEEYMGSVKHLQEKDDAFQVQFVAFKEDHESAVSTITKQKKSLDDYERSINELNTRLASLTKQLKQQQTKLASSEDLVKQQQDWIAVNKPKKESAAVDTKDYPPKSKYHPKKNPGKNYFKHE